VYVTAAEKLKSEIGETFNKICQYFTIVIKVDKLSKYGRKLYRVSIKTFSDYKDLLQENYVE